jgi:hypothetical protein
MADKMTPIEMLLGEAVAKQLVVGQAQAIQLEMIHKQLEEIKSAVSPRLSDMSFYVTVPDGGGLYTLQVGSTIVDFEEGVLIEPNGHKRNLRLGLKSRGMEEMRSVALVTSGPISISLDGQGKFDLEAGEKLALAEFGFKSIYLETKVPGNTVKLMASSSPSFTVFYDKYFTAELQTAMGPLDDTLYEEDLTSAQYVSLDLGTMRRLVVEAYGKADVKTVFTLETSDDAVHWFVVEDEDTTDYSFGGGNTKRYIRLSSAAAGAPGDLVSLTLSAVR